MTISKRILAEKRTLIVPLVLAILVNIGVYAFAVYPLGIRSASAVDRAVAAAAALRAATKDFAAARDLISGKQRADEELATFYGEVLPADASEARRKTYTPVVEIARKANVTFLSQSTELDEKEAKKTGLGRLHTRIVFQCSYENFRAFIYELESAPAFMIIDVVTLAQADQGKPLALTIEMSTYYRADANGT